MRTLVPAPPPARFEELLERRRRAGADRHEEVWEGVLHFRPEPSRAHLRIQQQLAELLGPLARAAGLDPGIGSFNLGEGEDDHRCPDCGIFREPSSALWNPAAALVLEIVSLGEESWDKLPFDAAHHVDKLLIVDPQRRTVDWLALVEDGYRPIERSNLIDVGPAELAERIDWPPLEG
jgi:hypothetical protein